MSRVATIAMLCALLLGCADGASDPDAAAPQPAADPAAAVEADRQPGAAPAVPAAGGSGVAWPEGVAVPVSTFIRGSDTTVNKLGQQRQRTIAEYQGKDFADVVVSLDAAMQDGGFKPRSPLEQPNGNTILRFDRAGYGSINLTVTPTVIGKAGHADSRGMLIVDAPMPVGTAN